MVVELSDNDFGEAAADVVKNVHKVAEENYSRTENFNRDEEHNDDRQNFNQQDNKFHVSHPNQSAVCKLISSLP